MKFGNKKEILSMALNNELIDILYPNDKEGAYTENRRQLEKIISILKKRDGDSKFTCYLDTKALNAFIIYANEVYQKNRNEATGTIAGYYLHDENDPSKKFIVATRFLQATGSATSVTCEFSYDDSIRHARYCEEHNMLPVVWIHSHPGFGVFYSLTDIKTLKTYYYCKHQVGIVVDNIKEDILGFKIYNGVQEVEDVFIIDIDECYNSGQLKYTKHSSHNKVIPKKKDPVSFKEVKEQNSKNGKIFTVQNKQHAQPQELDFIIADLSKLVSEYKLTLKEMKADAKVHTASEFEKNNRHEQLIDKLDCAIEKLSNRIKELPYDFQHFQSTVSDAMQGINDCIKCSEERKGTLLSGIGSSMSNMEKNIDAIVKKIKQIEVTTKGIKGKKKRKDRIFKGLIILFICSLCANIFLFFKVSNQDESNDKLTELDNEIPTISKSLDVYNYQE